jgi:hypothetical protein
MAYQDRGIASHTRSYGREEEVLEPHHYLRVLLRKPGAFAPGHADPEVAAAGGL